MSDEKDLAIIVLTDLVEHLKQDQYIKVNSNMHIIQSKTTLTLFDCPVSTYVDCALPHATLYITIQKDNIYLNFGFSRYGRYAPKDIGLAENSKRLFNLGDPDYKKHITLFVKRCINLLSAMT